MFYKPKEQNQNNKKKHEFPIFQLASFEYEQETLFTVFLFSFFKKNWSISPILNSLISSI
jgi:hypothetical protein